MDGARFDRWTKSLTSDPASRRATFRALAGGALGALAGLLRPSGAAACRNPGRSCGDDSDCCSRICRGGTCRCLSDRDCPRPANPCRQRNCDNGRCRPTVRDNGTACGTNKHCVRGTCTVVCSALQCDSQLNCPGDPPQCFCQSPCSCGDTFDPAEGCVCTKRGDCDPATMTPCDTSADCAPGSVCFQTGCITNSGTCMVLC